MSTDPRHTALAVVAWPEVGRGELVAAHPRVDHGELLRVLTTWDFAVASVDVPFGWPDGFTAMIASHESGPLEDVPVPGSKDAETWRVRSVALRATDAFVYDLYGGRPMAVGFEKLGATAASWALIEASLGKARRAGSGTRARRGIVETYPAAQLKAWGEATTKPSLEGVKKLARRFQVKIGKNLQALGSSADLRDAFVCALTSSLIATKSDECHAMTDKPSSARSKREGVIWLHDPGFDPAVCNQWTFDGGFARTGHG